MLVIGIYTQNHFECTLASTLILPVVALTAYRRSPRPHAYLITEHLVLTSVSAKALDPEHLQTHHGP